MNAISTRFESLRQRGEAALIAYVVAGFPTIEQSMESIATVAEAGADIIEVGVPFSDPVADGPTIQRASHAALQAGATLDGILDALARSRPAVPLSLMSYLNPLMAIGRERLLDRLGEIGVAGLIVPDLPLEESAGWSASARERGIALTLLAAPTSDLERTRAIARSTEGFLYYVSLTGITGARRELPADLVRSLGRVRSQTPRPVAVGFGISRPSQIRNLRGHCDGVVVGSRLVQAIEDGEDLAALVRTLKAATRPDGPAPEGTAVEGDPQCSSS